MMVSTGLPQVWVLTSKKLGDNTQALSVANALGWPYEIKRLEFHGLNHFHFRFLGPSLRKVDVEKSSSLSPPWPDLVITIGRRSTPVALWIRQQAQGQVKLAQVGQSRVALDNFALVIANPQYHLPNHPHLIRLSLPLLYNDPAAVTKAKAMWRPQFSHLPRPWTALFIGGTTKPFTLDVQAARDLMHAAKLVIARDGGSMLAATSRRTSTEATAILETEMPTPGFFYRWSADKQHNPYLGILGLADRFIVTGESISMLTEVVRQQKPLAIYPLPVRKQSLRLRYRRVLQALLFSPDPQTSGFWRIRQRLGDTLVHLGLLEYQRDFALFHQQLIDQGLAVMLGEPFPFTLPLPPDELPFVVQRIKALFPRNSPI